MVLGFQHDGDQLFRCRHFPFADAVKRRFAMMGEGCQRVETEHRARTLQRVKAAEHGVDLVLVGQVVGQVEKAGLDLLQQFGGLSLEDLDWIGKTHLPRTFLTILTRFSGSNGLVSQPVAPAALARALRSASDSVVRKMIGMPV